MDLFLCFISQVLFFDINTCGVAWTLFAIVFSFHRGKVLNIVSWSSWSLSGEQTSPAVQCYARGANLLKALRVQQYLCKDSTQYFLKAEYRRKASCCMNPHAKAHSGWLRPTTTCRSVILKKYSIFVLSYLRVPEAYWFATSCSR